MDVPAEVGAGAGDLQGKMTAAKASRQFDLTPSEMQSWIDDGTRGMENALPARPEDVGEQYERRLKDLQRAYGEAMRWQVRERSVGCRPRIQALPSEAQTPDERWAIGLSRIWGGRDGWLSLALVIDCHTRQLLGWHLSRSGKASTAAAALEQALITRFGTLGRVETPFLLRSGNGLVCTSRDYTGSCAATA